MDMNNKPKDPMITFRSTIRGKNSKGGDRSQLYLTQEMAMMLIETLTSHLDNPKGIKLDLHTSKKEHEGRSFDSSIAFVRPVQDSQGGGFGGGGASGGSRFKAAPKMTPEEMKKKMEALKAAQVKESA